MPISDVEIRLGYRFLLGREPESPEVYRLYRSCDFAEFHRTLAESSEGRSFLRGLLANGRPPVRAGFDRWVVCFIHLEKTGGTTLHQVLEDLFSNDRVTPVHMSDLTALTIDEVGRYDVVSGHFSYHASLLIPAARIARLSLFRDPVSRLISFYRFHRAHPSTARLDNEFVRLAQELPPARFFTHPVVLSSPRTNNAYLRSFGTLQGQDLSQEMGETELAAAYDLAQRRIRGLHALGITERMSESIDLICRALHRRAPQEFSSLHRTDDMIRENPRFTRVEHLHVDTELLACMEPLVHYDQRLYAAAEAEFSRRLTSQ
jgi:hypothetical protein